MLIILLDIFITIRLRKRAVVQPGQTNQHQSAIQKQMFILMLASIAVFLVTNLPIGIYKIISPRGNVTAEALTRTSIYTALVWFQSLNYAVRRSQFFFQLKVDRIYISRTFFFFKINFYMHCLSSTFFRKEFRFRMKFLFRPQQEPINISVQVSRTEQQRTTTQRLYKRQ